MAGSDKQDGLIVVVDVLNGMNAKLLQLSAEVGTDHITGKALIKELLGGIQEIKSGIDLAVRSTTGSKEDALRQEISRLGLLLEVADQFHSTLDTDEIAARILDSTLFWIGADRGVLLLQDPEIGEHLVKVGRELTESTFQSSEVAIPRTVVGQVLKDRMPVFSTDVQGDSKMMSMASVRDLNVRSLACLPLIFNDEILGVIYFDFQAAERRITQQQKETLTDVCRQAAMALANANRYQRVREWARRSNQEWSGGSVKMIGTSSSMKEVFELVNQVALTPSTSVLITGASGTGKELVARGIHDLSSRSGEPFVAVNCAALPSTLLESELFGYEKGAFTDAKTRHIGLLEQADDGTLMLDEIGEMSAALQSKLLRVLEDRKFRRLGGEKDIPVDIRVVAATNVDIDAAVKSGEFREDLFYRLNVFPIRLPALKDRGEDVILIANAVIDELNSRLGTRLEPIDPLGGVARAFREYDWPGNVRELRNVLERAMILCRGRELAVSDFPSPIGNPASSVFDLINPRSPASPLPGHAFDQQMDSTDLITLDEMKTTYINRVLEHAEGDRIRAAEILGINPSTLYRKVGKRPGGRKTIKKSEFMQEIERLKVEIMELKRGL